MVRWPSPKDCGQLYPFIPEIFITDDSRRIRYYNCLGFALGRQKIFKPERFQNRIPDLLCELKCKSSSGDLSSTEKGLALFQGNTVHWHVAKHLRGIWFESKFSTGLRVIHQLKDLKPNYGEPSFWTIDNSEPARQARSQFVQSLYGKPLEKLKEISDTLQEVDSVDPGGSEESKGDRFRIKLEELANRKAPRY